MGERAEGRGKRSGGCVRGEGKGGVSDSHLRMYTGGVCECVSVRGGREGESEAIHASKRTESPPFPPPYFSATTTVFAR